EVTVAQGKHGLVLLQQVRHEAFFDQIPLIRRINVRGWMEARTMNHTDDLGATGLPRRRGRGIGLICQEFPEICDYEIGAVFTKRLSLIASIHTDHESKAAGVS